MRLGIISDIHEDVQNLERALHLLEKQNVDEIACLGDIAGFTTNNMSYVDRRNASACIELVQKNCKYIVAGNHDLSPVHRIPKYQAGFNYPDNWYELDYPNRKHLAGEEVWLNEETELNPLISDNDAQFLKGLPEFLILNNNHNKIFLSHYLYPDLTGSYQQYYHNFGPIEPHLDFISEHGCSIGFSGHKHFDGATIVTHESSQLKTFGQHKLTERLQWIVGPSIVGGKSSNGFMVMDTERVELEIIPLQSPKVEMVFESKNFN